MTAIQLEMFWVVKHGLDASVFGRLDSQDAAELSNNTQDSTPQPRVFLKVSIVLEVQRACSRRSEEQKALMQHGERKAGEHEIQRLAQPDQEVYQKTIISAALS